MTQLLNRTALAYQESFLPLVLTPTAVLDNLRRAGLTEQYMLYAGENRARIALGAVATVSVHHDMIVLRYGGQTHKEPVLDPLKQVEALLAELPIADWSAYGYIGFDLARYYYPYRNAFNEPLLQLVVPESELRLSPEGIRIRSLQSPESLRAALLEPVRTLDPVASAPLVGGADRDQYERRVELLRDAIRAGHLQKAILSRCVRLPGSLDAAATYTVAERANHAVRSYCLELGTVKAVGFSPEILMQVNGEGIVVTNPLAGTRPRGADAAEDAQLYGELFTDAKEVKEHALSIWLAQQEIASVAREESLRIFDFMQVKRYRCVQHLSSRVGGRLAAGRTQWDALKVLFPGITVSGIDKQAALAWIDKLEDEPRGIYAGAIGWLDSSGQSDLAIAIRSVYQYGDTVHLNAGAGIVAESLPEREYLESVHKLETMRSQLVLV